MARFQYVVLTKAVEGRLEEFEQWYDGRHLADVCAIPEITSAKRFRVKRIDSTAGEQPAWDSVALYEFETDDPDAVVAELVARANTDAMPLTEALAFEGMQITAAPVSAYP